MKSSRATWRSRPPPTISVGVTIFFRGSIGSSTKAEAMPGSIKLCYGESDMTTPEFICRAAYEAALAGHTFYTHTAGYTEGTMRHRYAAIAENIRRLVAGEPLENVVWPRP